tara:strand:- start:865 stop:1068 length:204 start_codon:yes stop_codon:yes gene_type:complete
MIDQILDFTFFYIVFIIVLLWILTIKEQLKKDDKILYENIKDFHKGIHSKKCFCVECNITNKKEVKK